MLSIRNNIRMLRTNNQLQINARKRLKSAEKLSSGYRINRSADDAAGLAISEKMRRQIRGLMRGTANAEDGISYVQTAEGAMNEVHDMLQRMNELTIQSLNGTLSDNDREYLNDEFKQLRAEIDRVSQTTKFNDLNVFEEHESAYYQISGNRHWNPDDGHIISSEENELTIHLSDDIFPRDYTITVPPGAYSTLELIDEIDTALENMIPPNPGFVFEYTKDGYCKLNLEGVGGYPRTISSVEGSLSYLLFDVVQGRSTSSILGTTVFDANYPLKIVEDQNDTLGFYVEKEGQTEQISIKIPAGRYSRLAMINLLNKELAKNPAAAGVTAKEYGDDSIQITGGSTINITGLKGNMFKLENSIPIYSSVFYDNVQYGGSTSTSPEAAYITGGSQYNYDSYTDKVRLVDGRNNVLRLKLNNMADFKDIKLSEGEYTIAELAKELNDRLADNGLGSAATAYDGYYHLNLQSSVTGSASALQFDTASSAIYAATYNALFCDTRYRPVLCTGQNIIRQTITGSADLSGTIALPDNASLKISVDGADYTISGISKTHASLGDLVQELNGKINTDPNLASIKGKVGFQASGTRLVFAALQDNISIGLTENETYKKLFEGITTSIIYPNPPTYNTYTGGGIEELQGATAPKITNAKAFANIPDPDRNITIEQGYDKLGFYLNGDYKEIALSVGSAYNNIHGLISELNRQLSGSSDESLRDIKASFENGSLTFTAPPPPDYPANTSYYLYFYQDSSAWGSIIGTRPAAVPPIQPKSEPSTLTTYTSLPSSITIDDKNSGLTLKLGGNIAETINIAKGTYSPNDLENVLNNAINGNANLNGKVKASLLADGKLQLISDKYHPIEAEGSFYKDVIVTTITRTPNGIQNSGKDSIYYFADAYIIGRKDLRNSGPIDIFTSANDKFIFDFAYTPDPDMDQDKAYEENFEITIPEGSYTGEQIIEYLQKEINEKFAEKKIEDFDVSVTIGGERTGVVNSIDDCALQIKVKRKDGKDPARGQYILDGIRGTASGFLFYKTTGNLKPTYITGSKRLPDTIRFSSTDNVLTMSVDSTPHQYTFPTGKKYTVNEFIDLLNDMFKNGDDNGKTAPIRASLENGYLRLSHKVIGSHTITNINGNSRSFLFLEEEGRTSRGPLRLQVSAESNDHIDIPRLRIGSTSLAIHSIIINKPKYAEKALRRVQEAITMVGARRGTYGAMQNRLEHLIANNNNIIENTQASESIIRDTDIAQELVQNSIHNVMLQAAQIMLTQANQMPGMVQRLLQA